MKLSTKNILPMCGAILGEYDARGDVMEETVYLGDTPIAVLGGGSPSDWGPLFNLLALFNSQVVHYITPDNLGAPHTITDGNGKKVWEWHHTPFGDSQPQELGFSYNLRFPGQINDPESGLYYNMFRDYNPNTGRYMYIETNICKLITFNRMPTLSRSDFEPVQIKLHKVHTRVFWIMMAVWAASVALFSCYISFFLHGNSYIPVYMAVAAASVPGVGAILGFAYLDHLCRKYGYVCPNCRLTLYNFNAYVLKIGICTRCKNTIFSDGPSSQINPGELLFVNELRDQFLNQENYQENLERIENLANAWIRLCKIPSSKDREKSRYSFAIERLGELVDDDPEQAWKVINLIWRLDSSDLILSNLATGPFDDLLCARGEKFIDRIEKLASENDVFKKMLGTVRQNSMSDALWDRVKAVAGPSL